MVEEYIRENLGHWYLRTSYQTPIFLQKDGLQFLHLGHECTGGGGLAAKQERTTVRSCESMIPEHPKHTAQRNEVTPKKCKHAYYFQVGGSFLVRL